MFDLVLLSLNRKIAAAQLLRTIRPDMTLPKAVQILHTLPGPVALDITRERAEALIHDFASIDCRAVAVPSLDLDWPEAPGPQPQHRAPLLARLTDEDHPRTRRLHLIGGPRGRHEPDDPDPQAPCTTLEALRDLIYTASSDRPWRQRREAWLAITRTLDANPEPAALHYAEGHLEQIPDALRTPSSADLQRLLDGDIPPTWPWIRHFHADLRDDLQALAHAPHDHLTMIDLTLSLRGGQDIQNNINNLHNANALTRLGLAAIFDFPRASAGPPIADKPHLAALTHLDLRGNWLGDDEIAPLEKYRHLRALTWLDLSGNRFGFASLSSLLRSRAAASLQHLALNRLNLSDEGARALAAHAPQTLRSLHIDEINLNDVGLDALLGHPSALKNLEALSASFNPLANAALPPSALCSNLRTLILRGNDLDAEAAAALLRPARLNNLKRLSLDLNPLKDPGIALIAPQLMASPLDDLSLRHCALNHLGAAVVAVAFAHLHTLSLSDNPLGPEGAAALATSPHQLARLKALDLGACNLRDEGVEALADAPFIHQLTDLALWDNHIGPRGARALARAPLHNLRRLHIQANALDDEALDALRSAPWFAGLDEFDI